MGEALQRFESSDMRAEEAKRLGVERSYFFINRFYEFRNALSMKDTAKLAAEIAEIRIECSSKGRFWKDWDVSVHSAGWDDFERYFSKV